MLRNFNEDGFDENGYNRNGYDTECQYSLCHDEKLNKPIPGQISMCPGEDIPME